jgi:hypothetical protein
MAPKVKTAKNSKLPKLSENCFEPVEKGGWPLISMWISACPVNFFHVILYAHSIDGTFRSQSSLLTLQIFVSAFSRILLKASTVSFACG